METEQRSTEQVLAELERRRRDRWAIAGLLVTASVAALVMLFFGEDVAERFAPIVALAFIGVSALFAGFVILQERRAAGIVRELVAERERTSALDARVGALETVHAAVREVASAQEIEDVFDRLLGASLELTHADGGRVLLRVGDTLTVATARGEHAPGPGATERLDEGVAGMAVRSGQPLLSGRGGEWSAGATSSVVAAPLRLPGRVVGALVLERGATRHPFGEVDRTAVALFAEQAALAMRTATRLDSERERAEELAETLRDRAVLAASVVHDLRAPLSAITGFVQLLREWDDRFDPEKRRRLHDDVLTESVRMTELLEGLLDTAAAEGGRPAERREVDLCELVRNAGRTAEGLAHRQGRARKVLVRATPRPVLVQVDPAALQRVLVNLVDNAIAYSPPGSDLLLRVRREDDGGVAAQVRDHGRGIDDEMQRRAYERFVSDRGGSGLGLYVARSLVEAHGGEVLLRSADDGGTVAEIRLPAEVVVPRGSTG